VWLATKVLPVVGINALIALVFLIADGTPHGLKVEHVEVIVAFHFIKQSN